jgi:hypothetical protein
MRSMRVYLACALTHVPRHHFAEYADFLHRLARRLSDNGAHEVKYALVNSDPQLAIKPFEERARLCYLWDARMVQEAEVVVAECSFPSVGLGIELQIAAAKEIPIIIIFRDFHDNRAAPVDYLNPDATKHELQIGEGFVSLMALGLPTVFKVHRYSHEDEGLLQVSESITLLNQ